MGIKTSKYSFLKDKEQDLSELEKNYLFLVKENMRTLYLSVKNNPYNIGIAMKKKQFNKISTIKHQLSSNQRKDNNVHWKDYLLHYFTKQFNCGLTWYKDIIDKIEENIFLNENKYLSIMFHQGYEIDTKPSILEDLNTDEFEDYDDDECEVKMPFDKEGEDGNIDLIGNKNAVANNNNNNNNNITKLSRIDLTKITENLGGSFSSKVDNDFSNVENRNLVKKFVKLFKQHVIDTDHPINQVIQIFEQSLSIILQEKIVELEQMNQSNEQEYEEYITDLCEEIVNQIQKFVIKTQCALKLFYTMSINLQCCVEEKDELINIITGILFKTGHIYDRVYQLFSMKMSKEIYAFQQKIILQSKITPTDLNMNVKFRLDDSTRKLMSDIIEKQNQQVAINNNNVITDNKQMTNANGIIPNNAYKIEVSNNHQTKISNKFHKKNPIIEYNTAIKIIRSVKYNNDPFEKMMLIASIGSEVTNCINTFWKGMDQYISSTYLTISPDDLVTIFLYIILKADMPEILIHEKIIKEFTTSTTQLSIMGYYYTTLQGSIDFIQKNTISYKQGNFNKTTKGDEGNKVNDYLNNDIDIQP